ncbi:MBL fold metallo-hydrolase [Blochmannia endosymbiont of Colobopsis nipponica]|uniref:MBL fold metallo-hydrolase n=1 Tax=Blochmannia endosymbiont of Colobopsis nipponica TaxID=2681987 RepID=UPI00178000E8|nr:MBL fold metallo-hydrolase [Blochmannia endosymbiont of Colobopsis nipponica]QOI11037.1 MBL fold metallo-hydrolase [Blochmannia endosymbiont of Colobopsis nipponica]
MQYKIIPVTHFQQNCSLIWCKKTKLTALVDPGGEEVKIHKVINNLKLVIEKILITHGHLDHVGSARVLSRFYNAPIIGPHQEDRVLLENLSNQAQAFSLQHIQPVIPDFWLKENDLIKIGNEITFNVLHCPGHSPGHVIFWNKKYNFILMGDVLFKKSIGRTDLPGGDIKQLINSIKKKILPMNDNTIFLPGHGPISTIGYERKNNPFLV